LNIDTHKIHRPHRPGLRSSSSTSGESPRRVRELTRSEERRALLVAILRGLFSVAVVGGIYFGLPWNGNAFNAAAVVRLVIGGLLFVWVIRGQVLRIARSRLPELVAGESVVLAAAIFLCLYASCYVSLSRVSPDSFNEHLDHTGALYFAITTFGTVGYGDIAARSEGARLLVSSQILLDLTFFAVGIRLFFRASRRALESHDSSD
jgi:voltage-gated potassium channel